MNISAKNMITVFASFYPNKNNVEDVRKILQGMVDPTRAEEGNVTYDLYSMDDTENEGTETFHLFEIYKDKEALDFHRETAHYKNYRANVVQYLTKPIQVKVLNKIK